MKNLLIDEVDNLYRCAQYCTIQNHTVDNHPFQLFCTTLRNLEYDLREQSQDDYWKELLHDLKLHRFPLYAAPLPLNTQAKQIIALLERHKKLCREHYPSYAPRLDTLLEQANLLLDIGANPLLDKIVELTKHKKGKKIALLVKEANLIPQVEDILAHQSEMAVPPIEIVNTYGLRGPQCYHTLIIIGPRYWYPNYVFRTPRAEKVHFIRYNWISDRWINKPIFLQSLQAKTTQTQSSLEEYTYNMLKKHEDNAKEYEYALAPTINWRSLSAKILKQTSMDYYTDDTQAKLYLLAKNYVVFLETDNHAKVLVLDLINNDADDDEDTQLIRHVSVSKLQSGMFLLLRTEGGGDYIIPTADKILGKEAPNLRHMQTEWKTRLKSAVDAKDSFTICIDLLNLGGSHHVSETNLRYWISDRSIRPQDNNDFRAILSLVGLIDKVNEYLIATRKIEKAHQRAGFQIRKLLLQHIATTKVHNLYKYGFAEFELPQTDGGSMSAFRIEQISPDSTKVSASRIGRPVQAKEL